MEELQLIIQMVAGLPTLTIWVLVGFLVYKLAVVGSTYGVIRHALDVFLKWKTPPTDVTYHISDKIKFISRDTEQRLITQLERLTADGWGYLHDSQIDQLKKAIDLIIKKEV